MSVKAKALALGALCASVCGGLAPAPAAAQFYLRGHSFAGETVRGDEQGVLSQAMPGATDAELRAALVWNLRAGLNVAALQCDFEPTLLTVSNYNAILLDHKDELKAAFDTMTKYFARAAKSKPAGQQALDQFGTRVYSSFVTVAGQFGFCQTASRIGRDAVFTPRGQLGNLAAARMRELRNSLFGAWGEQAITRTAPMTNLALPRLDPVCWDKKGRWVDKKCGPLEWPPQPA